MPTFLEILRVFLDISDKLRKQKGGQIYIYIYKKDTVGKTGIYYYFFFFSVKNIKGKHIHT